MRDPLSAMLEEKALTPSQLHTLVWLGVDGPLTMGELARRLCITDKTVTGVVDRLERAELVRRVREDEDRRVIRVALSEEGKRIHAAMRAGMVKKVERFLELLEPDEKAVLFRVLERLQNAIHQENQ